MLRHKAEWGVWCIPWHISSIKKAEAFRVLVEYSEGFRLMFNVQQSNYLIFKVVP